MALFRRTRHAKLTGARQQADFANLLHLLLHRFAQAFQLDQGARQTVCLSAEACCCGGAATVRLGRRPDGLAVRTVEGYRYSRLALECSMAELGTKSKKHLFRFGIFELDQDNGELRKQGVRIQLQPKPLQMLEMLLERPNEIITREELRRRLWGGNIFVEYESGLNTAANRLRLKLGDSAESPRYIETVARTGYRFIAPVEKVEWDPTAMQAAEEIESPAITALPGRRKAISAVSGRNTVRISSHAADSVD